MKFYRKVTFEDFIEAEKEFKHIPDNIKELMLKEELDKYELNRVLGYRVYKQITLKEYSIEKNKYVAFVNANNDYKNGKDVYTDY